MIRFNTRYGGSKGVEWPEPENKRGASGARKAPLRG
jgi:hypothetical protein